MKRISMETNEKIIFGLSSTKVGPWNAIVYHQVEKSYLDQLKSDNQAAFEQEAEVHPDDCLWWQDWHACNCGAFDVKE
jgi:hypothetical protein